MCVLSCVWLFATPWTIDHQAPLFMELSGLPFPSPGDLYDLGIEWASPAMARGFFTTEPPGKAHSTWSNPKFTFSCFSKYSSVAEGLNLVWRGFRFH